MLKLIIENDPSKLQISQVEHKMKTYERFYENSNVFKYREPPYPGYLKENRQILLLVDGFILAPEMYKVDEKYNGC